MALKIVTGGSTGAADGTLVSSGNPLVITALNTPIDAHIRCDDGYWSNDQDFDVPAELEVSFDGGTTWYDNADEPITAPEIYAVNVPIKIRQTTAAASTSGSFVTDGTYTAIAALSTPTLTCTVAGPTQIDLSWTNVANEDASPGYTIERSLDGSSWSALTTKAANVTTHSDTGLTTGQHYYYRVKAEGSGRYSDSGWGTDDDTPLEAKTLVGADDFTDTAGTLLSAHTPSGTGAAGTWAKAYGGVGTEIKVFAGNKARGTQGSGSVDCIYAHSVAWTDGYAEADVYVASKDGSGVSLRVRGSHSGGAITNNYQVYFDPTAATVQLGKIVSGSYSAIGSAVSTGSHSVGATVNLQLRVVGTSIKVYVDGSQVISTTDSSLSSSGKPMIECYQTTATSDSTGCHVDNFKSYTLP